MEQEEILDELGSVLKERGRLWIPASGFSMGRRWRNADALEIEAIDSAELKRFDVAVFRRGIIWVAHRIVKVGATVPVSRGVRTRLSGDGLAPPWASKGRDDLIDN